MYAIRSYYELRLAHADGEQVRVERRCADEREDLAAPGVDGDDRAAPPGQLLGREGLQVEIDAQVEVIAGRRVLVGGQGFLQVARFRRDLAAAGIGDDVAVPGSYNFV